MIRRMLAVLAFLVLAGPALAGYDQVIVVQRFDVDGTSYNYCRLGPLVNGTVNIATSGSSTTVTGTSAFTNVAVADVISGLDSSGRAFIRTVSARASASSITVDTAVTLTGGVPFQYRTLTCGTGAGDGWFNTSTRSYWRKDVFVEVSQIDVTGGIDFSIECRVAAGPAHQVLYGQLTSATFPNNTDNFAVLEGCDQMRVGTKISSADDGADTTTHAEMVNITFQGTY